MIPMLERVGTLETLETVATLDKLKLNSDRSKFKFLGTEKVSFTNILSHGQHTDTLESTVIQLYSHGVTTREISDLIEKMYGSYYSAGTVSNISK